MTKPLSPAAQAVFDATYSEMDYAPERHVRWAAAAALEAVADQVVPKDANPHWDTNVDWAKWRARDDVRDQLLAIAAELKGLTE